MEMFYYCKNCNAKVMMGELVLLDNGKCPKCASMQGFSSISNEMSDPFSVVTIINEIDLKE